VVRETSDLEITLKFVVCQLLAVGDDVRMIIKEKEPQH
jgi:hypothetical protein